MCPQVQLPVPGLSKCLYPGDIVKLGRFETTSWRVCYGWFSWGGNRPWCGWHLKNTRDPANLKPLQLTDLDDIYLIESAQGDGCHE